MNNAVFPAVGMPHVLSPLQGTPRAEFATHTIDGVETQQVVSIKSDGNGEMDDEGYNQTVLDLVNFLVYSVEPVQTEA